LQCPKRLEVKGVDMAGVILAGLAGCGLALAAFLVLHWANRTFVEGDASKATQGSDDRRAA
jgi:hypothetical protein